MPDAVHGHRHLEFVDARPTLKSADVAYEGRMGMFVANAARGNMHALGGRSTLALSELQAFPVLTDVAAHLNQKLSIAIVPARHAASYVQEGKLRELHLAGTDPDAFGRYRICASILRQRRSERIPSLFFESLLAHCRAVMNRIDS